MSCGSKGSQIYSNPSYPMVEIGISTDVGYCLNDATDGKGTVDLSKFLPLPGIDPIVITPYFTVMLSYAYILIPHLTTRMDIHLLVESE